MPTVRLTEKYIAAVKAEQGQRLEVFDQVAPGLILRVTDQGRKTWVVRYRTLDGRQPRLTLGTYPGLDLASARTRTHETLARARDGKDPAGEKRRERQAARSQEMKTFSDLAERYFQACETGEYRPRSKQKRDGTLAKERTLFKRHVTPTLGGLRVDDIDQHDVKAVLRDIVKSGARTQANRAHALIRQVFSYGVSEGRVAFNPARAFSPLSSERARTRILSDAELAALWGALARRRSQTPSIEGKSPLHISQAVAIAIKLALLLLQRRAEIAEMRRDELDLVQGTWTIPGERTKNGSIHLVPIGPMAVALLQEALRLADDDEPASPYVFPSPWDPARPISPGALTHAIRDVYRSVGIPNATLHDLRRTGATVMASERLSVPPFIVSKVLNHKSDAGGGAAVTQQHYNLHLYAAEKRKALLAWERLALDIVGVPQAATKAQEPSGDAGPAMRPHAWT